MIKKITLLLLFVVAFSWQGTAQFVENFDGGLTLPAGWATIDGGDANSWEIIDDPANGANSGTNVASIAYSTEAHDDYLITPAITVTTGSTDRISFFIQSRSSSYLETYEVLLSTATNTATADFSVTLQAEEEAANSWTQKTFDLSSYVGQTVYVAIRATGTNEWELYVDDFVNDSPPTTPPNCDATLTTTTDASITDIAWSAATGGVTGYKLTVGTTSGGTDIENATDVGNVTSYTFTTPLTAATTYYATITPYNNIGDATCNEQTFTTWEYCIPQSTSADTYIDTFTTTSAGNDINNTGSGYSTDGYVDNTSMFVDGAADGTFDFFVGDVGGTVGCSIWVDWNNDFTFDPATETEFTTSGYSDDFTGTITIPSGTANGDYTMRVMIDWSDSDPSDDACNFAATRGEVEDYTIRVDNTLGVQNTAIAGFAYYPNPVNNQLSLRANNAIDQVEVLNILGQTVLTATPSTTSTAIDMTALNQGTYFVRVQAGDAIQTVKVIKN